MTDRTQEPRPSWPPRPGYFRLRLVKGGWAAPAQIVFADGMWQAVIDGEAGTPNADPVIAGVDIIWSYGTFSNYAEYAYLNDTREAARKNPQWNHPAADATQPMSRRRMAPITV